MLITQTNVHRARRIRHEILELDSCDCLAASVIANEVDAGCGREHKTCFFLDLDPTILRQAAGTFHSLADELDRIAGELEGDSA